MSKAAVKPFYCTERVWSSIYKGTKSRCGHLALDHGTKCRQHALTPEQRVAHGNELVRRAELNSKES